MMACVAVESASERPARPRIRRPGLPYFSQGVSMTQPLGNNLLLGTDLSSGQPFTLSRDARAKHVYVPGVTGAGKSKLIESCVRQDICNWAYSGSGLLLLDPHGRIYDELLLWLADRDMREWPIIPMDLRR